MYQQLLPSLIRALEPDLAVPSEVIQQERLWRALVNISLPYSLSESYQQLEDRFLELRREELGVVSLAELDPVAPGLYLWQGDITRLAVEGIVNAANNQMLGCFAPNHGCIDNAIHTFAGSRLRKTCANLMQGRTLPTSQVLVTPAFHLPSQAILHTVGPIVNGPLSQEHREQLQAAYQNCLQAALDQGLKSLAFCCISTGEFGFPQNEAAQIAVETVKNFQANSPQLLVVFNVFKDEDLEIYRQKLGL